MTIQKHNDAHGWKRGLGHYSGSTAQATKKDDSHKVREIQFRESNAGFSGPLPAGGPPAHKPKRGAVKRSAW